jgi:hypothetical protein
MRKILNLFFQIFLFAGSFNFLNSMEIVEEDCGIESPYLESPEMQVLSGSFEKLSSSLKEQKAESPSLSALNKELAGAIRSGKVNKVKKLLNSGAKMEMINTPRTGNSALHLAVLAPEKVFATIELALESGAEKNARGKDGRTFLYTFISQYTQEAFTDFAACVWLYNVKLDVVDNEGNTLFHAAAEAGRLDWIVFLLGLFECKFEAEEKLLDCLFLLQAKNELDETAFDVAQRRELFFQKAMQDFDQSKKYSKIATVLEKEINLLTQKWENSKQSLTTSFEEKDKEKIRKKVRRHSSVGEYH